MNLFDIEDVVALILRGSFTRVVLQFNDDLLSFCGDIYAWIRNRLPLNVDMYITADSSWGTSCDDVSAMHVDGDILIHFGSDLSAKSSQMPVILCPKLINCDVQKAFEALSAHMSKSKEDYYIILYDPGLYWAALKLYSMALPLPACLARLPPHLNAIEYSGSDLTRSDFVKVGGLLIPKSLNLLGVNFFYLGDNTNHVNQIMLQYSNHLILNYKPTNGTAIELQGANSPLLNERYGGIARVKDAKTIGIIVGSMGTSAESMKLVVSRLEYLIQTACKRFYTFIMGRINEAKLSNFPEIDIYCLITNENGSFVKPKTFPVPVITPFELELGLGARTWESCITVDIERYLENDISEAARRVIESRECNDEDLHISELLNLEEEQIDELQIVAAKSNALAVISGPGAEYYSSRTFKGLLENSDGSTATDILQGKFGIASGYSHESLSESGYQLTQTVDQVIADEF